MNNIKLERLKRELTQKEVAKILDIDVTTYGKKERQEIPFLDREVITLAKLYKCSLDYLLLGELEE